MNAHRARLCVLGLLAASVAGLPGRASDHADPMSLIQLDVIQESPEANITDLHAFVVDADGRPLPPAFDARGDLLPAVAPFHEDNRLILSLCVRRALRPEQAGQLNLDPYTFRVHLDLSPPVRFVDATAAHGKSGADLEKAHADLAMQALYGGIVTEPAKITDRASLEFELSLGAGDPPQVVLDDKRAWGMLAPLSWAEKGKKPGDHEMGLAVGVFDDPFIFPRFFRRNVVGVVVSIPISKLVPQPSSGAVPILLWATTHKGNQQIDHVGRSLRTQLPRFGHLNDKPPAEQVAAIQRVHAEPTITEALLGSMVAPLFALRHYDWAPDVMIYDLRKPALFPNGRWFEDDVARILAEAGETLLLELSYAESREAPRATTNDKEFGKTFPYLAAAWTKEEIEKYEVPGSGRPRAPDASAIATPTFDNSIWRTLYWTEVAAIAALTAFMVVTVRSAGWRIAFVAASLLVAWLLDPVRADNIVGSTREAMAQPMQKLERLALGAGWIVFLLLAGLFALGRRLGPEREPALPADRQGPIPDDARMHSHGEIHSALFDPEDSRPYYKVWGDPATAAPLPLYQTTFKSITADLFSLRGKPMAIVRAARRSLRSRADLRWGADGKGFRHLVHPMGVCLAGTWDIDPSLRSKAYTGYFAAGKQARVIARYSLGGNHVRGGHHRSLGLAGKLFPPADARAGDTPRAHFITQEDLGGAFTNSVTEAILTNSPPVSLLKRGSGLFAFLPVVAGLLRADTQPSERQLYEIAELEKPDGVPTSCPRFMRLRIADAKAVGDEPLDFRDEILGMIYDPGDPRPKRELVFTIEVSDEGRRTPFQRVVGQKWKEIGTLRFHQAMASYNGDFVVHFHHPPWRRDRNDPETIQRRDLRA